MGELVQARGLKELDAFLRQLPEKINQNVLTGALRAGAKVIESQAKQNLETNGSVISAQLRDSIKVSVRRRNGRVTAKITARTDKNEALWVEYGTAAHWIMVRAAARPGRMTRRGYRKYSIGTLNAMAERGSLKIGENFVGASVAHPGAKPKPFMRPALESTSQAVVAAAAEYIKQRMATKDGISEAADMEVAAQ